MAASTYLAQVEQLYIAYFGRPADPTGQAYWAAQIDAANGSIASVLAGFSASAESQALFGGTTTAQKVAAIYQNAFGRAPEPAGLSYWVSQLDSGKVTQAQASWTIQQSAGAGDAAVVQNKLTAALAFTAGITTTAQILGYTGAAAAASARSFLSGVSDTASTTAAVANAGTAVAAAVAANASGGTATFALTTGLDNLTGTGGNDVFVGVQSATAGSNTVSVADQINGGAGNDTLKVFVDAAGTNLTSFSLPQLTSVENIYYNGGTLATGNTLDVSTIAGVTGLELDKSGVVNGTVTLKTAAASSVTIDNYAATTNNSVFVLDGANKLTVNGVTATTGSNTFQVGTAASALTAFTLNATGANSALTLTNPSNLLATLTVTGDKAVAITENLTALTTVNASANTGGVTLNSQATNALTFTGGTGNDVVNFAAGTFGSTDILDGGAGTDALGLSESTYTTATYTAINAVKNFEVLNINAAGTLDASLVTGISSFGFGGAGTTGAVVLNNAAAATKLTINNSADSAQTLAVFNKLATDGNTITIDNEDAAIAAHTFAGVGFTGASLAIASVGKAGNILTSLGAKGGSTVTITGAADFTIGSVTLNTTLTSGVKIDGSAATGVLNLTGNTATVGTTLTTVAALGDTLIGGAKADVLKVGANGGTVTGGAGNDTFDVTLAHGVAATANVYSLVTVTDFTKGDKIAFGTATALTKIDVSASADLQTALTALANSGTTATNWGVFQGNTYVVANDGVAGLSAADTVVKLAGALDLSTSTVAANTVTYA